MSRQLSSALTAYGPPSILEPLVPSFRTTPRYTTIKTPKTTASTPHTTTTSTSSSHSPSFTNNSQATAKAASSTASTASATTTTAAAAAATTLANLLQSSLQPSPANISPNSLTPSLGGEPWNSWTIIVDLANVTLVQAANNVSDGMHDGGSRYSLSSMIIMGIVAGILSLLTVVGNVMVMISFKIDKQLQTISNYFLFSLAIADFAIGLISMPLFAVTTIVGYWPLGPHICDTWLALDYLASNASVLNLLIISFDRYFSVTRPLTYRAKRTTNRAAIMISAAWGISLILWPPWIYSWPYIEGKRTVPQDECYIQFIETNQYITFLTALAAFYFPVTIMCFLYYRIWKETKKRQKDLPNLQAAGKKDASKRSNSSEENIAINYSGLLSLSPMDYGVGNGVESWPGPHSESAADIDSIYMANMLNDTNYHDLPSRNSSIKIVKNVKESYRKSCLSSIRDWCIAWWHSGREDCDNIRYELDDQFDIKCNSTTTSTTNTNMPAELYALDGGGLSDDGRMPASSSNILLPDISVTPLRSALFEPNRHRDTDRHLTATGYSTRSQQIHQPISNSNKINNNNSNSNEIETPLAVSQESVYTILIRLPCDDLQAGNTTETTTTPSIKMIHDDIIPALPTVNSSCRLTNLKTTVNRNSDYNNYLTMNRNLSHHMGGSDMRLLPLNTKIIPKPLTKATTATTAAQTLNSMGNTAGSSVVSGIGSRSTIKKKRKTQEKRQESKAAKTLSAILLSFIITWTPYNILVLIKPLTTCSDCIPNELWEFFYALCYINSTINPMCYALCNASFRRTYIRILTCKWHSRNREAMVRGVYN